MDTVNCGFCSKTLDMIKGPFLTRDGNSFCNFHCFSSSNYFNGHAAFDIETWNHNAFKNLAASKQERKAAKEMRELEEEAPLYVIEPQGQPIDNVNNPKHYTEHPSKVECIQITEHMNFCLGNAMKYIWRADLKGGKEDLEKAIWYLEREISRREKK